MTKPELLRSRLLIEGVLFSFVVWTVGCASSVPTASWKDAPKNQPVTVTTKSGSEYSFEDWTFGADSSFVGLTGSSVRVIPLDSIATVALPDRAATDAAQAIFITVGVVLCAGAMLFMLYAIFHSTPVPPR
ncbi:MAG: hypothetical protein WBD36_07470 [Bacteroidota bacterium]